MSIDQMLEFTETNVSHTVYTPDTRGSAWCVLLDSSGRPSDESERETLRTALSVYAIASSIASQSESMKQGKHPYDIERWNWILANMPFLDMTVASNSTSLEMNYLDLASGLLPERGTALSTEADAHSELLGALASAAYPNLGEYPHVCLVLEIAKSPDNASELVGRVGLRLTGIKQSNGELNCTSATTEGKFTGFSKRQKEQWAQLQKKYATPENLTALRSAKHYFERVVS